MWGIVQQGLSQIAQAANTALRSPPVSPRTPTSAAIEEKKEKDAAMAFNSAYLKSIAAMKRALSGEVDEKLQLQMERFT
jgi:hypothetical protein